MRLVLLGDSHLARVGVMTSYALALTAAFEGVGATVVDAAALVGPLGPRAFVADDLHLSGPAYDVNLPALRAALG